VNGGEEFTLLDACVKTLNAVNDVSALSAFTLVLGALVQSDDTWAAATYSTANLSEWHAESGISLSHPQDGALQIQLQWRRPEKHEVELDDAGVTFETTVSSPGTRHAADWSIETAQVMHVKPTRPMTIAELHRRYAQPLRALTTFISDRPDSMTVEAVRDADAGREAEIWRHADRTEIRPWRVPGHGGYLCQASELPNYARSMRDWWNLHEKTWPALGVFAEHISQGPTCTLRAG
jgi:hypothetical protein